MSNLASEFKKLADDANKRNDDKSFEAHYEFLVEKFRKLAEEGKYSSMVYHAYDLQTVEVLRNENDNPGLWDEVIVYGPTSKKSVMERVMNVFNNEDGLRVVKQHEDRYSAYQVSWDHE